VRDGNLTTENAFQDVQEGMWCNTALSTMKKLGLVLGKTDTYFNVNAPITRAEFATICARFDKNTVVTARSNLTDIDDHWAKAYIERAVALGWIQGYSDGTFRPDQYITRAQAMTIINRMLCRIPETEEDLLDDRKRWSDNLESASYYLAVNEATNSHVSRQKGEVYEAWTSLNTDPDWSRYQ
jgi:hypothetical protein